MAYREEGVAGGSTTGPQFEAGMGGMGEKHPAEDLVQYWREYARQRPEVVALWAFGIGFVLGWRLKPW